MMTGQERVLQTAQELHEMSAEREHERRILDSVVRHQYHDRLHVEANIAAHVRDVLEFDMNYVTTATTTTTTTTVASITCIIVI